MTAGGLGPGQNPRLIRQTVKRMVYGLSRAENRNLDDRATSVYVAMLWRADHDTGEATLTDEEITRASNLLLPYIRSLRSSSRNCQRQILQNFLYKYSDGAAAMSVERSIIAMFKTMVDHDLKDLVLVGDENESGGEFKITALGWMALAKILIQDGHNLDDCTCNLCPKTRRFLGSIYYFRCTLCGAHEEAPHIKAGDLLHCGRCHGIECIPSGLQCAGGPITAG